MRYLFTLLLIFSFINGDEFDMFDIVDEADTTKNGFKTKSSFIDANLKLNYQYNDDSDNDEMLFLKLNKSAKTYLFDIRITADEDTCSINLKELYYKTTLGETSFIEMGRINIKEGIARGYNPTDYFRGSSSLTQSIDPKDRQDNRLGSILNRKTLFIDDFTVKFILSPKISVDENSIFSDKEHYGLHLDKTNYHHRASLSIDYKGFKDISSSAVVHYNEDNVNLGFNLSYINSGWIFYTENSYKSSYDDFTKAVEKSNSHPAIQNHFKKDEENIYQSVLGFNYTSQDNIVTTLEYIHNSAGLDSKGWNDWFDLASQNQAFGLQLNAIKGKIYNSENSMSKEFIFLHSLYMDMFTNLDASVLIKLNPYDKSTFSQIAFEYAYSDNIQFNSYLKNYQGSQKSEYGSLQNSNELLLELQYFF